MSLAVGRSLPSVTAIDDVSGQPAVLIGISSDSSRPRIYETAQNEIISRGLDLPLDSVFLVDAADRGFLEMKSANDVKGDLKFEVRGRTFVLPISTKPDPRHLQNEVLERIRELLPLGAALTIEPKLENWWSRPDALIRQEGQTAFVEVLGTSIRSNLRNRFVEAFGNWAIANTESFALNAGLLIVTLGPTHDLPLWRLESPRVRIVEWQPANHDLVRSSIAWLLRGPGPMN